MDLVRFFLLPLLSYGLDNGRALTPPMGWNSYMAPQHGEEGLGEIASFLESSGLRDLGYVFVNTDEGWELGSRDESGLLQWDPTEYPNGIPAFIDLLNRRGLKYGIYGAASGVTCGTRPGQLYNEDIDAKTYAEWGVSYLKSDNCATYALDPSVRFAAMRDALNRTGRPMVFSIEPFSTNPDAAQSRELANLWRVGVDINRNWGAILDRVDVSDKWAPLASPGGFNDPDMIAVQNPPALTLGQNRIYFGLWALAKAPLLLSADLPNLTKDVLAIIGNAEVVGVNQDRLGVQGRKLALDGRPLPWLVGLESCSASAPRWRRAFAPTAPVGTDTREWSVDEAASGEGHYVLRNTATRRCLQATYADGFSGGDAGRDAVVLLPCNATEPAQSWRFTRGLTTVTSVVNVATGGALAISNATLHASIHSSDVRPVSDAAYGSGGVVSIPQWDQPPCTVRSCDDYDPSQMWYYSATDGGRLRHAQYVASMNHRLEGDGYWLTPKVPTWRHHCLAHTLSTGNFGTVAGVTEVWGGPLEGGAFVLGLVNRGATPAKIQADWSLLEGAVEGAVTARELWSGTELGVVANNLTATVAALDMLIFKLTPLS